MKFLRLQLNFAKLSSANLLGKAKQIIRALSATTLLPQPIPQLADLQKATTTFGEDLGKAASGDHDIISDKNASRLELEKQLVLVGQWVVSMAGNNLVPLEQSGYNLAKTPQPRYIQPAANVSVINGITSGQIIIIGKKDKAALSYQFMVSQEAPSEATVWTIYTSSRSKYTLSDLKRGNEVYVRYAVIGARNQMAYSKVASHIVQ